MVLISLCTYITKAGIGEIKNFKDKDLFYESVVYKYERDDEERDHLD